MARICWNFGLCLVLLSPAALSLFQGYDLVFKHTVADLPDDLPRALLTFPDGLPVRDIAKTQFTVCLFAFLENENTDLVTLFNFSSNGLKTMSQMTLQIDYSEQRTILIIADESAVFNATPPLNTWTHICATWDSVSGHAALYMDGDLGGRVETIMQGGKVFDGGYFVLGANPISYNFDYIPVGKFTDGVDGKLTQVNLWNTTLSTDEVNQVQNCTLEGNVVSWSDSTWRLYGNVQKRPTDAPCGATEWTLENVKNLLWAAKQQIDKQLQDSQKTILMLAQKYETAEQEIATLNQKLEAGATELNSLKEEAGSEIRSLTKRFDDAENELNSFKLYAASEIRTLKQSAGSEITSLSKRFNDAYQEFIEFKQAGMNEIRTLKDTAGTEINSMKARIETAQKDLDAFKKDAERQLSIIKHEAENGISSLREAVNQCCEPQ